MYLDGGFTMRHYLNQIARDIERVKRQALYVPELAAVEVVERRMLDMPAHECDEVRAGLARLADELEKLASVATDVAAAVRTRGQR